MTDLKFSRHNSQQLPDPTRHSHKNTYKNIPTNQDSKTCTTMDIVYKENKADVMTDGSTASSGTQATRCSARLREKLNKLIQTPATTEAMDINAEELKKHARASQPQTERAETPNPTLGENRAPEVKKPRNNETPPPHVKAKALFIQKHTDKMHNDTAMEEQYKAEQEIHPTLKELTAVDEDDFEEITEKEQENNQTAKVSTMRKQPESETIAQPTEQDI